MNTEVPAIEEQHPRASWLIRHKISAGITALGGAIAVSLIVLAAIGHQSPIAVRGDMEVEESCSSAVTDYPDISDGAQVVITDSSGKVLADTALGGMRSITTALNGVCDYPFAVKVPAGQSRYGIAIGHDRGTVWFTAAQMKHGPALDLAPAPAF